MSEVGAVKLGAVKFGPVVQVQIGEDGRPVCPHCFEPMTAVGEDRWQCPDAAEWSRAVAEMWAAIDIEALVNPEDL